MATKLYPDRGSSDAKLLRRWAARPVSFDPAHPRGWGYHADRHVTQLGHEAAGRPEPGGLFERAAKLIFDYEVFPAEVLEATCLWRLEGRGMEVGDTILQRFHVERRGLPACDLIGATRVDRILADDWERGFRYLTVKGHPERGMETFLVRKDPGTGQITFMIEAVSAPGRWITWLFKPWARAVQLEATAKALEHLRARVAASAAAQRK